MGSNSVVSIRVEALGVSITIADGSIAIEQTKTEIPAVGRDGLTGLPGDSGKGQEARAAPKLESPAAATSETVPASTVIAERLPPLLKGVDDTTVRNGPGLPGEAKPVPASPGSPVRAGTHSGKGQDARSGQTKPLWSDEEVEKLRALYPTHSASAIAKQLGRGFNAVRGKARNLGLRKAAHPTVIVKSGEAKPAPKPRPLSAAVISDPALRTVPNGFSAVSLFDHQSGQCRWIVSDVWPVMYCGAPVMDSSSWCGQHSRRVFNSRPQGLTGIPRAFRLKAWP